MKILVTGASGFIGRHLVSALMSKKHDIYLLVRLESKIIDIPKERLLYVEEEFEVLSTKNSDLDSIPNLASDVMVAWLTVAAAAKRSKALLLYFLQMRGTLARN